ncbi:MAG: HAD family hydrolase [Bdellovibrionales bacterium]|nr:HAD family hydrolase [Bdellovibrionales bacterium]
MLKEIELILFDLDGTLVEFHHDFLFDQAHLITEQLGHGPIDPQELEQHFSEFSFFDFIPENQRELFIHQFWSNFDWNNFPRAKVLPGAMELLHQINASNRKSGIVTSRAVPVEQLARELEHTGLIEHMTYVRTRSQDHLHWSDKRDSLASIIEESGLEPSRIAMVGDIPPDISSARVMGLGLTVGVLSGGLKRSVLEHAKPDHILDSVAQISELFFSK